jgi:hypothetical protein
MIEKSIIIGLLTLSIWYTMQDGEIFEGLGKWFEKVLPERIHPALFACNVCLTPWYGSVLYWVTPWQKIGVMGSTLIGWPVAIIVAMGFNIVINKWSPE